ncbi:hypothetical protein JTB14_011177 [Gonioctena quinquepunctata]|nr:hypothetical protein JTB14_011177 [Gonioctena quinquepunctata]
MQNKRKLADFTSSSDSEGFKGTPKKIRRDIKTIHKYSISPKKMSGTLKDVKLSKKKGSTQAEVHEKSCQQAHKKSYSIERYCLALEE